MEVSTSASIQRKIGKADSMLSGSRQLRGTITHEMARDPGRRSSWEVALLLERTLERGSRSKERERGYD